MTANKLYLMCLVPTSDGLRRDYTEISPDTARKITKLYRAKRLPKTFLVQGKEIASETIFGFSDKPVLNEPNRPKITSWDELRKHVKQQEWYKKAQPKVNPGQAENTSLFPY